MPPDPDETPPWVPRADVFVNSTGDLVVKVELAALRKENLELTVEGERLSITGQRPNPDRQDSSLYLAADIEHGRFNLAVEMPPGFDLMLAKASYQNGLLRIVVPPKNFGRTIGHF
jgi:HSP20 family protein